MSVQSPEAPPRSPIARGLEKVTGFLKRGLKRQPETIPTADKPFSGEFGVAFSVLSRLGYRTFDDLRRVFPYGGGEPASYDHW